MGAHVSLHRHSMRLTNFYVIFIDYFSFKGLEVIGDQPSVPDTGHQFFSLIQALYYEKVLISDKAA